MGEENSGEEGAKATDGAEGGEENKGANDTQADDKGKNAGGADDKGASGDDKKDDDSAGNDADDDKGGGEDGAKKSDKKDDKETDKKPAPKADEEPTTRKRNADFIIERKSAKIAKMQVKDKDDKTADKGKDEDADDNDGVAPEDAEIIDKRIAKALEPFAKKQVEEQDKAEVDTFVTENPEFKPYADKVLKWAQHPSRQGIPIKAIFYEVAGDDLLKIGAERGKKADIEAKKTTAGGGNNRSGGGGGTKPVWEQTPQEFEAEQAKVRNKQPE